jgi:hypothetical protein
LVTQKSTTVLNIFFLYPVAHVNIVKHCKPFGTARNNQNAKMQITTQTKGILLNVQTVKDMGTPKIIAISNRDG